MSRYEPLTRYLESRPTSEAPLTFREVENILGRSLPNSARLHQAWWSNTTSHSHADSWMRVGWSTSQVDLSGERVVFGRDRGNGGRPKSSAPASGPSSGDPASCNIDLAALSPLAVNLVERRRREDGGSFAQAIDALLTEAAVERKRRLLDRLPVTGTRSGVDSVDLIREDRDGR